MFGEILASYSRMFKMGFIAALVAGAVAYVGYLKYQVWTCQQEVKALQEFTSTFESEKAHLESTIRIKDENLRALNDYYKSRKHIDVKDGELKPEELQLPRSK